MNAKIKELAEQANVLKYKVWEVGAITVTNAEDLERFAELIVKECAYFSMVATDDHYDVEALYKHFGIDK